MPLNENAEERLIDSVSELRDHVQVLWHAIDELREVMDRLLRAEEAQSAGFSWNGPIDECPLPLDRTAEAVRSAMANVVGVAAKENASEEKEGRAVPDVDPVELVNHAEAVDLTDPFGVFSKGEATRVAEEWIASGDPGSNKQRQPVWANDAIEPHGDGLTVVENGDGDVAIYSAGGEHLATEATRGAAFRTAELVLAEKQNGWPDYKLSGDDFDEWVESLEAEHMGDVNSLAPSTETGSHRPYSLDDMQSFQDRFESQQITATELKTEFCRLLDSRDAILDTLIQKNNAKQLKAKAARSGSCRANRQTKAENAADLFRSMTVWFNLHRSVRFSPFSGETYEDALAQRVEAITDDDLQDFFTQNSERQVAHEKAINNPETLEEFRTFLQCRSRDELTDDQFSLWDRLHADRSRQTRTERHSSTVEQFQSAELDGLTLSIKEGYHDKRQCPVWVVQMSKRVEPSAYDELKKKARTLGGKYSFFKKEETGFQFFSQEAAQKFIELKEGEADRTDQLEALRIHKMENAAERFVAMADRMAEEATATLEADDTKLKNTHRRAEQAASARADAYSQQATANTLRSVADDLETGDAQYLDGIRAGTQVHELKRMANRAKANRIRHLMTEHEKLQSRYSQYRIRESLEGRPVEMADIRFAKYPFPQLHPGNLERAFAALEDKPGLKQATAKMKKFVKHARELEGFILFNREYDVALLTDYIGRAKAAGYDCYWFEHCTESYKRLRAANIHDEHELRAALRELLPHLSQRQADDPVKRAEDELRGKDLPGFYPTPRPIIEKMLEAAGIQPDDVILEPSCGKGDILDAVRSRHPDVEIHAIEQNRTLAGVLAAKGYGELIEWGDFLEHEGEYDVVLMNPPFERGLDAQHVRKAFDLLKNDGRLVAIMSKGPFFRSDAKSREFREWLDELDHDVEELPGDAFRGVDAFRQTGVQTALLTIHKQ